MRFAGSKRALDPQEQLTLLCYALAASGMAVWLAALAVCSHRGASHSDLLRNVFLRS